MVPASDHSLDPLTTEEIRRTVAIVRRDQGVTDRWRFASIELREPPPRRRFATTSPAHRSRAKPASCAGTVTTARRTALVSLTEDRVTGWMHEPDGQPNMTNDEWHECDEALRHEPRLIEALAARGITDMDWC